MADQTINNKRIFKNTLFLYIRMVYVLIISLYTTRAVLSLLGVVDYGIYNVVGGFVGMLSFLNNSLSNGIQRFYNYKLGQGNLEEVRIVYDSALLIQALLAIIVFVILETVGLWYINNVMVVPPERLDAANWLFHFSVLSLVFVIMQIPFSAAIMAHERMNYFALVSITDATIKLGCVLLLKKLSGDHLFQYGVVTLSISALTFLLYFVYSKRRFPEIRMNSKRDIGNIKEVLSFTGWNVFGTFALMLKTQGLTVLLNAFFGPIVNAARGVASQVNGALQGFSANIVSAVRPQLVQSYAMSNYGRVKNLMFSLSKVTFILLFMLSVPIIIEINTVLDLWLGHDNVPEQTALFTALVLINMIISSMNTPLSQVVHATGKMKKYQIGTSIVITSILPVSLLALYLGAPAASVFLISIVISCVNQIVCLLLLKQIFDFKIRDYVGEVVLPCLVLSVVGPILPLVLFFVMPANLIRLMAVIISSVFVVSILSYFVILDTKEKELIKSFIQSKTRRQ